MSKDETPVLTNEMLLKMLLDTQKQLAAALENFGKPYVDPAVLAQKKQALEERRKQVEIEQLRRTRTKEICPHFRVDADGNFIEGKYNIKWMQHGPNIILGICGTCFSQFDARDSKDAALLRKDATALKNMGRSREIYIQGQ